MMLLVIVPVGTVEVVTGTTEGDTATLAIGRLDMTLAGGIMPNPRENELCETCITLPLHAQVSAMLPSYMHILLAESMYFTVACCVDSNCNHRLHASAL